MDREAITEHDTGRAVVGLSMPGGYRRLAYTDDLIKIEGASE